MVFSKIFDWSTRDFICGALLAFLFILGSAGNVYASETSETAATCEPADVVRVRVGNLHFNLPKERQLKLGSTRFQLASLAFSKGFLFESPGPQKLDGNGAIGLAPFYCQSKDVPPADVHGFGLARNGDTLVGFEESLREKIRSFWVFEIKNADETRMVGVLSSQSGKLATNSGMRGEVRLHKKYSHKISPVSQYFVQLSGPEQRLYLLECRTLMMTKGLKERCIYLSDLQGGAILKGSFLTEKIPIKNWVDVFQKMETWYQGLL